MLWPSGPTGKHKTQLQLWGSLEMCRGCSNLQGHSDALREVKHCREHLLPAWEWQSTPSLLPSLLYPSPAQAHCCPWVHPPHVDTQQAAPTPDTSMLGSSFSRDRLKDKTRSPLGDSMCPATRAGTEAQLHDKWRLQRPSKSCPLCQRLQFPFSCLATISQHLPHHTGESS